MKSKPANGAEVVIFPSAVLHWQVREKTCGMPTLGASRRKHLVLVMKNAHPAARIDR
jgi:hypothetical protein